MQKILAGLVVFCLLLVPAGVFAGQGGNKGPSDKAHEKARDKAKFKRGESQAQRGRD